MKKLLPLIIFFVVLISLCSEFPIQLPFPQIPSQTNSAATIDSGSPDLYANVEVLSPEVKSGRNVQLFFELRNKQTYSLKNVSFVVYDHPCFIESNNFSKVDCGHEGTLKSNESCSWSWKWTADDSNMDRSCSIKFQVSYNSNNSIFQDIAILSESEYNQRELTGTLKDIPVQSTYTKGPLDVYLTFSESQPFIANKTGYDMNINYYNVGDGIFVDESKDIDIKLNVPDNIKNLSCGDKYTGTFPNLQLNNENKPLKFIKGRSVPTNCKFNTSEVSVMSIRTLNIEISYNYTLYDSFSIAVSGLAK